MFDSQLLGVQKQIVRPLALRIGSFASADQVTLTGFFIGLAGGMAIWAGWFWLALLCLAANRMADGMDGEIAREQGPTDRGAFLDIACDFVFYAVYPLCFALYDPAANALPAAIVIASFVGTGASFLAFASVAAKKGDKTPDYPTKGIPYLGGLAEGAETIAFFVLITLFPSQFYWMALIYAAACWITTLGRFVAGYRAFQP